MRSVETSPMANRSNANFNSNSCSNINSNTNNNTGKRRSTWRSLLTPSYKSRSDEFLKLFCDTIPSTERLIADYSCALHREILIHGRIYISVNYIAFYSNLFTWVTKLVVKLRDVSEIYKANTAKIIPNAIQIVTTNGDKHVFASFIARDKSYVMILRIWQNNLMFERMSDTEIRNLVHFSYGRDLGMTDDEEFIVNSPEPPSPGILALDLVADAESHKTNQISDTNSSSNNSINHNNNNNSNEHNNHFTTPTSRKEDTSSEKSTVLFPDPETIIKTENGHRRYNSADHDDPQRNDTVINQVAEKLNQLTDQVNQETDESCSSENMRSQDKTLRPDADSNCDTLSKINDDEASLGCRVDEEAKPIELTTCCQCKDHAGQIIVDYEFDINVDTLFTLIFTNSKFICAYMTRRGLFNIVVSSWKKSGGQSTGSSSSDEPVKQSRQLTYSIVLNHVLAKQVDVEECQAITELKDGVYVLQSTTINSGVPYSEAFTIDTKYCLTRKGDINRSRMIVHTLVNFKKEKINWRLSIVKAMIERQSLQGVTDFITDLKVSINQYISNPLDFDQDLTDDNLPKDPALRDKLRKIKVARSRLRKQQPIVTTDEEQDSSTSEYSDTNCNDDLSIGESIEGSRRSTLIRRKRSDSTTINLMTLSNSNSENNLDRYSKTDSLRSRKSTRGASGTNILSSAASNISRIPRDSFSDTIRHLTRIQWHNKQMLVFISIILLITILITNIIILHRLSKLDNCKPNISTDYNEPNQV